MKWIVALVGATLVTIGATMALLMVPIVVYPKLYESKPGLIFTWGIATPLGLLAGAMSFRATLRQYPNPTALPQESAIKQPAV